MGKVKSNSPFVDGVMEYYALGHSVKETALQFNVTVNQVNYWAKVRNVTNGRDRSEINRECAQVHNASQMESARARWKSRLRECNFELLEYNGKGHKLTLKCLACGEVIERVAYTDFYNRGASCPHCEETERQKKQEVERIQRGLRKAQEEEEHKLREAERIRRFDEIHICKICGCAYTPRQYMESCGLKFYSNPGYCSSTCKKRYAADKRQEWKKKSHKHSSKHYSRARKLGLPRERGVNLINLIERNGLTCAICGLPCFYEGDGKGDLYPSIDHIIPMSKGGGHTWDNVQIAHRICNTNKRDYIGEAWHNGTEETT